MRWIWCLEIIIRHSLIIFYIFLVYTPRENTCCKHMFGAQNSVPTEVKTTYEAGFRTRYAIMTWMRTKRKEWWLVNKYPACTPLCCSDLLFFFFFFCPLGVFLSWLNYCLKLLGLISVFFPLGVFDRLCMPKAQGQRWSHMVAGASNCWFNCILIDLNNINH